MGRLDSYTAVGAHSRVIRADRVGGPDVLVFCRTSGRHDLEVVFVLVAGHPHLVWHVGACERHVPWRLDSWICDAHASRCQRMLSKSHGLPM